MTWESVYFCCFLMGLLLTIVSVVFGAHFNLPIHVHLPHVSMHHGGHVGHGVSPLNLATLMMFLTWFGGAGYLMTRYHNGAVALGLVIALLVGLAGAAAMYLFLVRVLIGRERPLRAADFRMRGVLGRLSMPIREGDGTGELIYSQQGTRRSCGARSEDGRGIERGTEVLVMRYENGIAYVRPWQEVTTEVS